MPLTMAVSPILNFAVQALTLVVAAMLPVGEAPAR